MVEEVFGIARNSNTKEEFCQTQYFVARNLQPKIEASGDILKFFFFFFCSDRQHEILQNKYAPTNIYTSRSHRCKSCKPSDNWGGSWKSTLMLTCINKFLVKVKGSIICRQAIQLNEVTMRLKTDNRWINNSKNGLIKILLFHKSSNCLSKCLQVHAQNAILSVLVTIFNMWKIYIQLSISRKSPHDTKEPHS